MGMAGQGVAPGPGPGPGPRPEPGPGFGGQTIQIQPANIGIGGQPFFNLTLNPPMGQQGMKRKAGDMDNGE